MLLKTTISWVYFSMRPPGLMRPVLFTEELLGLPAFLGVEAWTAFQLSILHRG